MRKPVRADWKGQDKIFHFIVLRMLWAIWWKLNGKDGYASHTIGNAFLDTVDYIEANTDNPESTRDSISYSLGDLTK